MVFQLRYIIATWLTEVWALFGDPLHWESLAIECHWYHGKIGIHFFSLVENGCQDEERTE